MIRGSRTCTVFCLFSLHDVHLVRECGLCAGPQARRVNNLAVKEL